MKPWRETIAIVMEDALSVRFCQKHKPCKTFVLKSYEISIVVFFISMISDFLN